MEVSIVNDTQVVLNVIRIHIEDCDIKLSFITSEISPLAHKYWQTKKESYQGLHDLFTRMFA